MIRPETGFRRELNNFNGLTSLAFACPALPCPNQLTSYQASLNPRLSSRKAKVELGLVVLELQRSSRRTFIRHQYTTQRTHEQAHATLWLVEIGLVYFCAQNKWQTDFLATLHPDGQQFTVNDKPCKRRVNQHTSVLLL